ncbi:MAG: rhomboid family intramembrane serine protease [bacterium]
MSYYGSSQISFGPQLSPGIKKLMIIMGVIFLVQGVVRKIDYMLVYQIGGLRPYYVWHKLQIWRLVTYMFLHGGLAHILFNFLALWMFGSELEYSWGTPFFLKYFFITGIGAGICTALVAPNSRIPTIGVSGAVYGLLLAFALTYPDRTILLLIPPIPIKAKYFAMIFGFIEFYSTVSHSSDGIAHIAHLGGMLIGYIYLNYPTIMKKIKKRRSQKRYRVYGKGFEFDDDDNDDDFTRRTFH